MSRNRLLWLAGTLAVAGTACMVFGVILLSRNIESYIDSHYQQYAHEVNAKRYVCTGSPKQVADTLARYKSPAARASHGDGQYLRYSKHIVIVGPDGNLPCTIRVESLNAGYRRGSYIFLGPGFRPGSPSGGSGGRPGGPGGSK
ncbi:DUF4247 domain-containing protein [Mycobacterium sp.]|uniref:DUF4247 domain-containing protein n=1 Tax=Mycobacterium sp. TaxID=1785 RepID=UPI003A852A72